MHEFGHTQFSRQTDDEKHRRCHGGVVGLCSQKLIFVEYKLRTGSFLSETRPLYNPLSVQYTEYGSDKVYNNVSYISYD